MFRNKELRVILSEEANEQYKELNKLVGEEIKRGINSSEHQTLLRSINRAIELIKNNPFVGIQIPKKQIALKYVTEYEISNLWKIDLSNYWRLIYTIKGEEIRITSFVLDIMDHKTYNRLFGYKSK
ncbi:MAG: hypothetical protein AABX29_03715 [Nanoarchaeota archaeon]